MRNEENNLQIDEQMMIGMWIQEAHTEDIKLFKDYDFTEREVYEMLLQGNDGLTVFKKYDNPDELMRWERSTSERYYQNAKEHILKDMVYRTVIDNYENPECIQLAEKAIERYHGNTIDIPKAVEDPLIKFCNELESRRKRECVWWEALPTLNRLTGGLHTKQLVTIAGRPGTGKSAFALQATIGVAEQGKKILYFPLEMSVTETQGRILSHKGYITADEVKTGDIIDREGLGRGLDYLNGLYEKGMLQWYEGVSKLEVIEKIVESEKPFAIVIDQLTQLRNNQNLKTIRENYVYETGNLKRIAMQHDCCILLLCQVSRPADKKPPTLADLKESGSIEEDSDTVILLHNKEDRYTPQGNKVSDMEVNIAKQRDGDTDKFDVILRKDRYKFFETVHIDKEKQTEVAKLQA